MNYYTYTHSTPDGDIFYVGKGCGHRAFSSGKRPIAWREMVDKHNGITIKIVCYFETELEAYEHEKALIREYRQKGFLLINATDGGLGVKGFCQTPELRAYKSKLMRGYKHEQVTCPHCGFTGGATATKRWHFDNCRGLRRFKARATVNGKRVFLGNYPSKIEAQEAVRLFMASQSWTIV